MEGQVHKHAPRRAGSKPPPPELHIPESSATVQVRVIDAGTTVHLDPKLFWQPEIDGFTGLHAPIYCFLVSHGDQHVLFDLGVRPDWENYAPSVVSLIKATTVITPGSDVAAVLDNTPSNTSVRSSDIDAVIWSHNHFDHIGDISRFPPETALVVGPGVRAASWPGWPSRTDAIVLDSDAEGREVREISFQDNPVRIGRFDAYDYFGDGSFYLLDAPGHAVGHLCALARTTGGKESSFVFMGADACHHAGILRPSSQLPLPEELSFGINTSPLTSGMPCPWDVIQRYLSTTETPFFTLAEGPVFLDTDVAKDTVRKIQELDAADNVLVLMAHDLSIRDKIPLYPDSINGWRSGSLKEDTRWLFCDDLLPALCDLDQRQPTLQQIGTD